MSDAALEIEQPAKRSVGRQIRIPFTQELADYICERLVGGESLRTICLSDQMPSVPTVCDWLGKHPEFADQYARAREAQADALADEILDISDNGVNDWVEKHGPDGQPEGWEYNGDAIQRSRLRVDARKWYAGKLAPKKYGERLDVNAKSESTVRHLVDAAELESLSADQRQALREIADALIQRRAQPVIEQTDEDAV